MFLLMNSLFCQNAALTIPTLVLISSSLFASSVIQPPKYLKRVSCSNGTLSNIIQLCITFCFSFLFIIITLVFLTLISVRYALHNKYTAVLTKIYTLCHAVNLVTFFVNSIYRYPLFN